MPLTTNKLDQVIRNAAANQNIDGSEARAIVKAAKDSGTKKPIDAIFKAIDEVGASIDAKATRFICANLDQKMSNAEWVRYVQKCASTAGVWGPSGDGAKTVSRADLPPAMKKVFDSWADNGVGSKPDVSRFEVAGKSAFIVSQYDSIDGGTAVGLYDEHGKDIEVKEDTKNVRREAKRIQGAYDKWFGSPALAAWKSAIEKTDVGVSCMYSNAGDFLEGKALTKAMTSEVKRVTDEMTRLAGKKPYVGVYKNHQDGSLLATCNDYSSGKGQYALFSKQGRLIERFVVEI